MRKLDESYINSLVTKLLNENLDEKADEIMSKLKKEMDYSEDEFETDKINPEEMTDSEIDDMMREPVMEMYEEQCEQCGSEMKEGKCENCEGLSESIYHREENEMPPVMDMDEDIYDVSGKFPKKQSFDYVEQVVEDSDDPTKGSETFCKVQLDLFGPEDPRFKEKCSHITESLTKKQKKFLDKNKNNKIDSEDFKMLRKSKKKETDEEVEEGNAFTGALAKAKKQGKDSFEVDGKKYDVKEVEKKGSKKKLKESVRLTESQLIELIEKIVIEEQKNIRTIGKPKGLTKYEQVHKADKKFNDDYMKSFTKKMKDYLKDGSKGTFEMEPKIFPKGNGELAKMDKKAYVPSKPVEDFVDNLTAAGQENLVYDEIHPNEDWITKNIEGSEMTGNSSKYANAVETPVNKKRNQVRKDNMLGAIKKQAYHKSDQPIVYDKAGHEEVDGRHSNLNFKKTNKVMSQLESTEPKETKKLNEEFYRMKDLMGYNRKTQ